MADYYARLIKMNENINLTAITSPEDAAIKHFADSIAAERFIKKGAHVIDVGTGGGFPGVPLKIIRNDIKMTLMDSVAKKTDAVAEMCRGAGIDVKTVCERAEEAGKSSLRGQFDAAVSRAVASLSVLMELCVPLIRKGGVFIAYKQAEAEDILDTKNAQRELCCALEEKLVRDGRALLVFRKTEKTPPVYPRRFAKIKKQPL